MISSLQAQTFFENTLLDYSISLGIIIASLLAGKIIYYTINRYMKKVAGKTESRLDDLLLDSVEEPLVLAIFIVGLSIALSTLTIPENIQEITSGIITTLIILDIIWLLLRFIDIIMKEYLKPITAKTDTNLDEQLLPILSKGLKGTVLLIGVLITLDNFGVNVTALIAGLGVGGLAIALASKDTVENMFGAFAILIDKPFTIHDRIILDGRTGEVMEVGLRSTRLRTLDNTELYVPNSKVVTSSIENISRPDKLLAVSLTLGVTYETTLGKIREGIGLLKKILKETQGVNQKSEPIVTFNEFGAYSLNIFVKYWVDDYLQKLDVVNEVNQKIKQEFEKAQIQFAFPTQTIKLEK